MPFLFKTHVRSWIAGRALRFRLPPTAAECEVGVVVPVDTILDQVGEDPDVSLQRRWKEDCRSYRLRLQLSLQQEIMRREKFELLLTLLLGEQKRT